MNDVINKIVSAHTNLFRDNTNIEKINVGFTNTIFTINDKYIIKVCSNLNNENKFVKEINFYNSNKNNKLIPKLYYSDITKKDIPYMYEITEKVSGVSLFNVWHKLDESQREDIIKQLCIAMKQFHSNTSKEYDWCLKTKDLFMKAYNKAKHLFNENEQLLLEKAYSSFDKYLESDKFVLVHNDLHFDNIIYDDGNIKLIDFERSLYAPIDFELDIIYRMIRKPWKFASEETEKYTRLEDYQNIMSYIEKYYPELMHVDNLYKRLAIYDIVYYLKQYIEYPHINELKEDILSSVNIVIENDN